MKPQRQNRYEELTGEFDYERNAFGQGESRTIIGQLADGQTVKGKAVEGSLETGLTYRFYGFWSDHPKYGRQFAFSSFVVAEPTGRRGTISYLTRGPGIGRKRAELLWELYGADALDAIRDRPNEVAAKVKGLTPEKATEAAAYFNQHRFLEATTKELLDLGLNRRQIDWAIGQFGARSAAVLRENMYVLMGCKGSGFCQADRLYLQSGGDPAAVHRVGWCSWNALNRDTDGHTWRPLAFCLARVEKEIAGVDADYKAGIDWAVKENKIVLRQVGTVTYAATYARANAEQIVAGEVHRAESNDYRFQYPTILAAAPGEVGPTQHQADAAREATKGALGILAGRPGTGKTFLLAAIARASHGRIAGCGPTGKAAVRMTESLAKAGVKLKAKTIHSLLKMGIDAAPEYNREHPLSEDFDLILCDEASMIDTTLAAHLLAARGDASVLFCGDPGQLSPVGHGAPLRDLIAARVPCGLLTEIQRNSGRIVQACKEIAERHTFDVSPKIEVEKGENFGWIEAASPNLQIERLKAILTNLKGRGFDQIKDCQVVVAVNKKSPLSRKAINDLLQGFLNPDGEQLPGVPFRVGDKIVATANHQAILESGPTTEETIIDSTVTKLLPPKSRLVRLGSINGGRITRIPQKTEDNKTYVANGEQGIVSAVFPRYILAALTYPDRIIRIPLGEVGNGDRDEDSEDEQAEETGCKWQLAYGITVHKSQGTDWPVVIPLIDSFPGALRVCKREWPYTAFSRAKQLCIGIGRLSIAREMCKTSGLADRKTFLVESIEGLRLAAVDDQWERELAGV